MKKTLGVFMNGAPEIEGFFAVAARLKARDRINLKIYVPWGLLRREPRMKGAFKKAGLNPTVLPNLLAKRFHRLWLRGVDAIVAISDPITDRTTYRFRHRYAQAIGLPIIFVQHSAVQGGLNFVMPLYDAREYAASLILTYTPMDHMADHFTPETMAKMRVVGFLKKFPLPVHRPAGDLAGLIAAHDKVVMLCHSFRWSMDRFEGNAAAGFFEMVEQIAQARPDTLFILRPHRGKSKGEIRDQQHAAERLPNVITSYADAGLLAGMTMSDILSFSDFLVSHASTAILDGIYAGLPSAVLAEQEDVPWFPDLPRVRDAQSLSDFLARAKITDAPYQAELATYGAFEANIERACIAIEEFMAEP